MRYGIWLTWGSIAAIGVLSVMSFLRLIAPETLGGLEALLLCSAWLGASMGRLSGRWTCMLLAFVGAITVIVAVWRIHPFLFIYVPAVGINLLLASFFFSTLRPGSEPAITRIARIEQPGFDDAVYAYTRKVTWAWALFFTALVIETVMLIVFAPVETTLLFLNIINYLFIVIFFLAENVYRRIHLRGYTHMSPLLLAVRLSRHGVMSVIRYRRPD